LIGWAENVYDQVLIDCPPMLAASDAALIGRLVDGMVVVVQPQKNHRRVVMRVSEALRSLKINVLGIVTNLVGDKRDAGYYGYASGYGDGYGEGYGSDDDDDALEAVDGGAAKTQIRTRPLITPRRAA
jgi:Mrp family chromosome partitioning ATPase